jgi:O-antigen ligase
MSGWASLPGRDLAAKIVEAAGLAPRWMPISLQPDGTRLAAAFLIPPIAMFFVTLHANQPRRLLIGWVIVATALIDTLIGLLQAGGRTEFFLYRTGRYTAATGVFANKNHHADFLLIGILLAPALASVGRLLGLRSPSKLVAAAAVAILTLGVFAADSRMGLLLLPLAVLPAVLLFVPTGYRLRLRDAMIAIGVTGVLVAGVLNSGVVGRLLGRFGEADLRYRFWPDVVKSIGYYWPVGSGLGSFIRIFQRHESMAALNLTYTNHAHNDFMEIALEAGIGGVVLVALGLLIWLAGAWRVLRPGAWGAFTRMHIACLLGVVILVAHSTVDYPLRTLTLASVFAFLAGCLAPAGAPERTSQAAGLRVSDH